MSELVLIVLVVWAFSALSRSAKKTQQAAKRRQDRPLQADDAPPARPLRPRDVDLPGQQTTMPTRWESLEDAPLPEPAAYETYTPLFADVPERPHERATREEAKRKETKDAAPKPVAIPGLDLKIDGDALVKGVIFSEILNRRPPSRRTR